MDQMNEGMTLLFLNQIKEADAIFSKGVGEDDTCNGYAESANDSTSRSYSSYIPGMSYLRSWSSSSASGYPSAPSQAGSPSTVDTPTVEDFLADKGQQTPEVSNGTAASGQDDDEVRDSRPAFALCRALTSVIKGIASLENNQLNECIERLTQADAQGAAVPVPWIGTKIIRGVSLLLIGLCQCAQHSFVRGICNILRSWTWLRALEAEALHFKGKEADQVRSAALLALGIFNLLISLMPGSMISSARWLTGFTGSRDVAMKMLSDCWTEEGFLAPWAALVLCAILVDVRTFLGEGSTDEDFALVQRILDWADKKYPGSIFFIGVGAQLAAMQRDIPKAIQLNSQMMSKTGDLPALTLAVNYKKGVYSLADMRWAEAADSFRAALQVHVDVERRSMVPCMAMYAGLAHSLAGDEEKAQEMFKTVEEYRAKPKKSWGRQDEWAFNVLKASKEVDHWWRDLDLFEVMAIRVRCVSFMKKPQSDKLMSLVKAQRKELKEKGDNDALARSAFVEAEMLRNSEEQPGLDDAVIEIAEQGLSLDQELSEVGLKYGAIPFLHFLVANANANKNELSKAKSSLASVDACGKDYWLYPLVVFKASQLKKRIGAEFEQCYQSITVGTKQVFSANVEKDLVITWDFSVDTYNIDFSVSFLVEGEKNFKEVVAPTRHESQSGPLVGSFECPSSGVLKITFDNSFSMFRSKTVHYRIEPDYLEWTAESKTASRPA